MGDISTHKEISLHIIPQLQAISPTENYTYVEFGNFLTDVSQFRDPTSYISGKKRIGRGAVTDQMPLLDMIVGANVLCNQLGDLLGTNLVEWLNVMFGMSNPADRRHGALATYFKHLCRVFAHIKFSADSNHHYMNLTPLSASEIDRVLAWAYTQYYPHEHLDYPPLTKGTHPNQSRSYKPLNRGLMGYLEHNIQFIAEEMSKIEFEWVNIKQLPAIDPLRCDLLVRLGHILHAVEDFYFHSNAVELRQWKRVLKLYPDREPKEKVEDYRFIVENCLNNSSDSASDVRLRRRMARRLHYPLYYEEFGKDPTSFSPDNSSRAWDFAYTGGFGSTDVAHTLSGGLEALEKSFYRDHPLWAISIPQLSLPLLKAILSEDERIRLTQSCANLQGSITTHKDQIESNGHISEIATMESNDFLTVEAAQALNDAYNMDREIELAYANFPGPGGFLLLWLTLIQEEADKSHQKVADLDTDAGSMYDKSAINGASEETVGTHSLLSKDSPEKGPLRNEAMALAKFASAALAVLLLQRIRDEPDPTLGLDWDLLVRHFVRIPPGTSDSWEEEVLAIVNAGGNIPTFDSIQNRPNFGMISAAGPNNKLTLRRNGGWKNRFEGAYRQMEKDVDF